MNSYRNYFFLNFWLFLSLRTYHCYYFRAWAWKNRNGMGSRCLHRTSNRIIVGYSHRLVDYSLMRAFMFYFDAVAQLWRKSHMPSFTRETQLQSPIYQCPIGEFKKFRRTLRSNCRGTCPLIKTSLFRLGQDRISAVTGGVENCWWNNGMTNVQRKNIITKLKRIYWYRLQTISTLMMLQAIIEEEKTKSIKIQYKFKINSKL